MFNSQTLQKKKDTKDYNSWLIKSTIRTKDSHMPGASGWTILALIFVTIMIFDVVLLNNMNTQSDFDKILNETPVQESNVFTPSKVHPKVHSNIPPENIPIG